MFVYIALSCVTQPLWFSPPVFCRLLRLGISEIQRSHDDISIEIWKVWVQRTETEVFADSSQEWNQKRRTFILQVLLCIADYLLFFHLINFSLMILFLNILWSYPLKLFTSFTKHSWHMWEKTLLPQRDNHINVTCKRVTCCFLWIVDAFQPSRTIDTSDCL